jgi:hypothetical protein
MLAFWGATLCGLQVDTNVTGKNTVCIFRALVKMNTVSPKHWYRGRKMTASFEYEYTRGREGKTTRR